MGDKEQLHQYLFDLCIFVKLYGRWVTIETLGQGAGHHIKHSSHVTIAIETFSSVGCVTVETLGHGG